MIDVFVVVEGDSDINYQNNLCVFHKFYEAMSFVNDYMSKKKCNWAPYKTKDGSLVWKSSNNWIRIENFNIT